MVAAEDPDFWDHGDHTQIHLIMFALHTESDFLEIFKQLFFSRLSSKNSNNSKLCRWRKKITIGREQCGFYDYSEVGTGFAEQIMH
jgi:hypothetical protein